jgi:hypothetical protein
VDKDAYFIPAGYDSHSLLRSTDLSSELAIPFEERIQVIKPKNVIREEPEVTCEDLSIFLTRCKTKNKGNTTQTLKADYNTNGSTTETEKESEAKAFQRTESREDRKPQPDFSHFMRPPSADRKPLVKGDSTSKLPIKTMPSIQSIKNDDAREQIRKQLKDDLMGDKAGKPGTSQTTNITTQSNQQTSQTSNQTTSQADKDKTESKRKLELLLRKPK